jgi:type I restriction enzyme S subunit
MLSGKMYRFRTSDRLDPEFLEKWLLSPEAQKRIDGMKTGISDSGLNLTHGRFLQLPVPVPSRSEQRRIVEILKDHLSHLDAAADYESAALRRLSALRRSALDAHFGTRGEGVRLDDLIVEITAGKSFGSSASPAASDEWGIIKVSAMTWGEFDPTQNKAVPATSVDTRYEIKAGDLLVSRANTSEYVGASVLVGDTRPRLLLSDKSLRITPKPSVRTEWLWRALQSPSARRQISSLATGTKDSMRNISQGSLRSVVLPTADAAEQSRSLAAYEEVEVGQQRLASQLELQSKRSLALRRVVLAAAFEGKLTGRQSDTDVIEELAHET